MSVTRPSCALQPAMGAVTSLQQLLTCAEQLLFGTAAAVAVGGRAEVIAQPLHYTVVGH
jgi:hypothetical protein